MYRLLNIKTKIKTKIKINSKIEVNASILLLSILILTATILACGPSDPLDAIRQAQARGQLEQTIEPLRALIKARPGDAEVLFIYGRTLLDTGRSGLAEWSLREAMKDPDWLVEAGLRLAAAAARAYNFDSAISISSRILNVEPENIDALVIRASAYAHSKMHPKEALVDVARVLELEPDNLLIMEAKIVALIGLERVDELSDAMEELGKKIDEDATDSGTPAWFCATSAIFAGESDDIELANSRWDKCLEANPGEPSVVWKAVSFYDSQIRYGRSMSVLQKALEANPLERRYRVVLATRYLSSQNLQKAEEILTSGTQLDKPELASASWLDLSKFYQEVGRYTEAAEAVAHAMKIVEADSVPQATLLFEYADALLIAGQFDQALEVVERLHYAPYREMIKARVAQEQRDFSLALQHFKAAFELWPDNPWARYYAAQVSEAMGNFDEAIQQYRYSIRISPGATDARLHLAQLRLAENRLAEAIQVLRTKASDFPVGPEGDLLSLELWARTGRGVGVMTLLNKIRSGSPELIGRAMARATKGLNAAAGPRVAVTSLRKSGKIDFTDLNYSEALRALVEYSHDAELAGSAGWDDRASADIATALAAHPNAASLLEIVAYRLERTGAPEALVREAYAKVLRAEPENARALSGLGRLAAKLADDALALSYFDRAAARDPDEPDVSRVIGACQALVVLGRRGEAEQRLRNLLEKIPFEGRVAAMLAKLQFADEPATDRTLDLAKRATRFGGGVADLELLARVYDARNEPKLSRGATDTVKALLAQRMKKKKQQQKNKKKF